MEKESWDAWLLDDTGIPATCSDAMGTVERIIPFEVTGRLDRPPTGADVLEREVLSELIDTPASETFSEGIVMFERTVLLEDVVAAWVMVLAVGGMEGRRTLLEPGK